MFVVLLGVLLLLPSVSTDFSADDYIHRTMLDDAVQVTGFERTPTDIFSFATGDAGITSQHIEEGVFPWWASAEAKLSFYRPLSSLTHALDHALFPESAVVQHLHSIAWFALLSVLLLALYRRFETRAGFALLPLLIFVIDDAHGPTVGWIANRNAIIAAALVAGVLLLHDTARRQQSQGAAIAAPLLLVVALFSGESAVAAGAFLFSYACFIDTGSLRQRIAGLMPYLGVVVVWRVVYRALGYGTADSEVYLDPASSPLGFASAAAIRMPPLLLGQLGFPWSDFAAFWPDGEQLKFVLITLAGLLPLLGVAIYLARRDRQCAFWLVATVLAIVPVCSTFPADRLLMIVSIGGAGLVGRVLVMASEDQLVDASAGRTLRFVVKGIVPAFVLFHLILAPLLLPIRAMSMRTINQIVEMSNSTIPDGSEITEKTVIAVNPPLDAFMAYIPFVRAVNGTPRPVRQRWLATGVSELEVTRVGPQALEVFAAAGFQATLSERMTRGADNPLRTGDVVELSDLTITITSTRGGRADRARFDFAGPLNSPELVWLVWEDRGFVAFTPPPIGETVRLPAIDVAALVFGD